MMYIQSRKRKLVSPFSSFLSNSFLLFSPHFPLNLNCQSSCKRKKSIHSEDPNTWASSSSNTPHEGDHEGGEEQWKGNNYEVFLSFRGEDTRKNFTDYLYTSLVDAGIHVFKDDNELPIGEEIGLELLHSITQSKISIPIMSENYASSQWCLRELAHMLKCKRKGGQIVLPIFYKVKPSKLQNPTGRLRDAINAHKNTVGKRVAKEWEEVLKEVTSLKGWESEKIDNGHEATLVKKVVRKVTSELKRLFLLNVPKQLVGIDNPMEHIMSFIDAKFSDTRIIGIYGMGGIGKTTLAKMLYNKLSSYYDYCSFVADFREESKRKGIVCIQKQLISDLIGDLCDVSNVDEGIGILESRFTSKKVLILLDDVDDNTHLKALVEDGSWFKAGSIVIITTRDKDVLDKARVSYKYQLNELLLDQSLVLFSRHAFRMDSPPNDYEVISHDIVSTTGGLPLALEVIGSCLCGKTKKEWEATSKKLQKVPNKKVQETLRISYDTLDYGEKQIFLDIACFFIGSFKQDPTYMWDACDFYPGEGLEVLSLKSLIKIDENDILMMHDQLRDLGREIVRLENPQNPQERSRVWISKEAAEVIDNKKGTSKIEALVLGNYGFKRRYTAEEFKELTNLRFIQENGVNFTGDFQKLLPQLRWLAWKNCPLDFAAANFHLKKLVVLNLSHSKISEDWGGWDPLKMATELKVLNLSNCTSLRRTPNLSTFKSLEILNLDHCLDLEEIHPSIGDIKTLISLNVEECRALKKLPESVGRMEELRVLRFDFTRIKEIPISRGCLTKLEMLSASSFQLGQLSESVGSLVLLSELYLTLTGIERLPESIGSLIELKILRAGYCASLAHIPSSIGHLTSLTSLDLRGCVKLAQLPYSIGSLLSLRHLLLSECRSLREIPASIGNLASLVELDLKSTAIVELPESIGNMQNLRTLDIGGTCIVKLLGDKGIVAELQELRAAGWKNLEGLHSKTSELVSPNEPYLDKLRKLSKLRSRVLALVLLKPPRTPPADNSPMDYQTVDSEHVLKRSRPFGTSDEPLAIAAFGSGNATVGPSLDAKGAPVAAMVGMNSESMAHVNPRIADEMGDKSRIWKLTEINEPSQCRSIRLPDNLTAMRVSRLIYTESGLAILALSSNAVHKLWKWQESDPNFTGKATTSVVPRLWQPPGGILMINDISDTNPEDAVSCFALSKNDCYLISASGGKITIFNMMTFQTLSTFMPEKPASAILDFHPQDNDIIAIGMEDSSIQIYSGQDAEVQTKLQGHRRIIKGFAFSTFLNVLLSSGADSQVMTTFVPPPPAATFLAFHPQDNNIVVIGMEDSSIYIYRNGKDGAMKILKGHQERITGLAFSMVLQVLVSSGADSQLRVWSTDIWENRASRFLQMPTRLGAASPADTRIQFNVDEIHLLVVHEMQIATYEVTRLACLQKWVTREASGPITDATYSCNGQSIYVSFEDGSIGVFTASTLRLRCRINPTAYIPPNTSLRVYALVITAHPSQPNQFAVGLTDGSVYILEPLECEGKWGTFPPLGCNRFRSTPKPPPIATIRSGNATVGARPDGRGAPVAAMVGMISESMADAKPRIAYESGDKSQIWKPTEVNEPLQCRTIRLPDIVTANSVSRLTYTNSGLGILALSSNAVHQLWKWLRSDQNLTGRATTSVVPQLWQPLGGNLMTNDISDTNPEDVVPCFALSKNDAYLISASGGMISLFNMRNFELMTAFLPPPPAATFLAFLPRDNNIIAIGREDSSIQIYNVRVDKVETTLRGHQKRITGLAFSNELDVLMSSSADTQLCVWSTDGWEKQASRFLHMPTGRGTTPLADTRVQFHVDQIHLLVVHETQIATYEAPNLECIQQWVSREASGPITDASYSCDGQSIYVSFEDGSISILTASTIKLRCQINPAAYIFSNPSLRVYPLVIAAHPFEPNQFALGLTDGSVYVLEPLECEGEWGASPPVEDCVGPSTTSGTTSSNQPPPPTADKAGLAQIWATRLRPR